jgi:2-polyprenyl-6-methoxyphenol hydroxylase-like FAD-dependent oxidoreductase
MDGIDSSLIPLADELVIEHSQIIIIGAGPVGLLTALKLAKEGIHVTVIEVERQVLQSPRATT